MDVYESAYRLISLIPGSDQRVYIGFKELLIIVGTVGLLGFEWRTWKRHR